MSWIIFLCGLIFIIGIQVSNAVKITNLKVPATYILDNKNNPDSLILDCVYEVGSEETGLVVKWLLNDNQIYQWIPYHKPFPLGFMKTRIDTTFSLSNHPLHVYRAMSIVKPEVNMTGEYTCSVQTFQSTDKMSSHLQILVPESDLQLTTKLDVEGNLVDIKCQAKDVYPQPDLTIVLKDKPATHVLDSVEQDKDKLYHVIISTKVARDSIESPLPIFCFLTLPKTNYTKKTETIFYDLERTATVEPIPEESSSSISRLESDVHSGNNSAPINSRSISLVGVLLILCVAHIS